MKFRLWLDEGHGWGDPGAIANGLTENVLTVALGTLIDNNLRWFGDNIQVFRTAWMPGYYKEHLEKNVRLMKRVDMANYVNADLFISLHFNSVIDSDPYGSEVLVNNINRTQTASILQGYLPSPHRGVKIRSRKVVLRYTDMPAYLLECNFISHVKTANEIKRDGLYRLACAITDGIREVISVMNEGNAV